MAGLSSLKVYLPKLRLERAAIASAVGWLAPEIARKSKGVRTLGFWDEDAVTMAVEAGRRCELSGVRSATFASQTFPFAEPQNAALVAAALRLGPDCRTQDVTGSPRAGLLALHAALKMDEDALILAADRPRARPGAMGEMTSGDGGAALRVSADGGLFEYLGGASTTHPMLDGYRATGADTRLNWEERWVREEGYLKQVPEAIGLALHDAGVGAQAVDWLVLPGTIPRIGSAVAKVAGLVSAQIADTLDGQVGDCGTAQPFLMLAGAMSDMSPGQIVVIAGFGQGATALVFKAGQGVHEIGAAFQRALDGGVRETNYTKLPVFTGMIEPERGLRSRNPQGEALTTAWRHADSLLGFVGGKCRETGEVVFPPSRLTSSGQGLLVDTLDPWPLADRGGRLATVTQDALAYTPHPPSVYGLVDFDGGGRLMMDITDIDGADADAGDAVRFVFRIKDRGIQGEYHRYFWKAVRAGGE